MKIKLINSLIVLGVAALLHIDTTQNDVCMLEPVPIESEVMEAYLASQAAPNIIEGEMLELERNSEMELVEDAEPIPKVEYRMELVYPTDVEEAKINEEYFTYIYEAAAEYDICPELIMAIIEKESSGNPNATSPNGSCKGLMQIYEKYHVKRMEKLGAYNLFDPEDNIWVGVDYLSELIDKHEDVARVLMVYNGDSKAFNEGYLSEYAKSILNRSEELEQLHYGTPILVEYHVN